MTMSIDDTKAEAILYKLDSAIASFSQLLGSAIVVNTEVLTYYAHRYEKALP
jgi:hypothetical protein